MSVYAPLGWRRELRVIQWDIRKGPVVSGTNSTSGGVACAQSYSVPIKGDQGDKDLPGALDASDPGVERLENREQIASLVQRYNDGLVAFLLQRLSDEAEAREVAQEAYLRLLQMPRLSTVRHLNAYLFRIAANLANRRLRERLLTVSPLELEETPEQLRSSIDGERTAIAAEELRRFQTCLDQLTPKCREVFVLHRLEGLNMREIAIRLHISERMVRKHIARAELHFHKCLHVEPGSGAGS